jgi:hypothetical protein
MQSAWPLHGLPCVLAYKNHDKKTACNTAEGLDSAGFCVLGSKPSPPARRGGCRGLGFADFVVLLMFMYDAGLYLSSGKSLNISVRLLIIVSGEGKYFL